jgi:dTDP-4-dehydrorhamnose 3,5-epimerase
MNNFTVQKTPLEGLLLIRTKVLGDARGFLMETFNRKSFEELGLDVKFVQCNRSRSLRGTLRGLHFQKTRPQGKLVSVTRGEVFDVAVDLRACSPTFGRWHGVNLKENDGSLFYISPGFAHGFCVVSDTGDFSYMCTDFYAPEDEGGLIWNDPAVGIEWPAVGDSLLISSKDERLPHLKDCFVYR